MKKFKVVCEREETLVLGEEYAKKVAAKMLAEQFFKTTRAEIQDSETGATLWHVKIVFSKNR